MPHLRLESSPGIDATPMLPLLVEKFCEFETVDPASVKAYSRVAAVYEPGYLAPEGFVHLEVGILGGRAEELRREMADRIFEVGEEYLRGKVDYAVAWTVELREMDPATYRKARIG